MTTILTESKGGWENECAECGLRSFRVVQFSNDNNVEAGPFNLCPGCLQKALDMFKSCASCAHFDKSIGSNGGCAPKDEQGKSIFTEKYGELRMTMCSGWSPAQCQCVFEPSLFKPKGTGTAEMKKPARPE